MDIHPVIVISREQRLLAIELVARSREERIRAYQAVRRAIAVRRDGEQPDYERALAVREIATPRPAVSS